MGIVELLLGLGVGGILTALVNGYLNRRKLSADATKVITEAASATVKDVREDNDRLRADVERIGAAFATFKAEVEQEREDQRQVLILHAAFDHMAVARLREAGITDMPDPPPLHPPQVARP